MVHLSAPPRFTLPPPPMPSSDVFDATILSQLTCSSIRQQHQLPLSNPRLILISSIVFVVFALLMTLIVILFQILRQRKLSTVANSSKSSATTNSDRSMSTSRSYETISSKHNGFYLESIDTSATTYSTDPSHTICFHCQQDREQSPISLPYYHTLDILPS